MPSICGKDQWNYGDCEEGEDVKQHARNRLTGHHLAPSLESSISGVDFRFNEWKNSETRRTRRRFDNEEMAEDTDIGEG